MSILAWATIPLRANILIMKTPKYELQTLRQFFARHKVANLDQLRQALGNPAR